MALITCKDCKKEFSTDAKCCPNCGCKKPGLASAGKILLVIIIGIPLIGAIIGGGTSSEKYTDKDYAQIACKEYVKRSLHDPDSAEFEPRNSYPAALQKNGYLVQVSLRAKNGFGALRKMTVNCTVIQQGGNWVLLNLKEYD